MGYVTNRKRGGDELPGGDHGLRVELDDERVCPACRSVVPPWRETCPVDDQLAVPRSQLPSAMPPPPAHLLDDEDE